MKRKILIGFMALMLCILFFHQVKIVESQSVLTRLNNPQVKGWLFGDAAQFAGEREWGTTGTADTLVVTGVDTSCAVFLTAKTATGTLRYDIKSAGDTIFVTSSGSETGGTDKYSYLIVYNAYGATD